MSDDPARLAADLEQIERDWRGVERLLDAMGLKDFLRVVAQMAKQDDKLARWLRTTLPPRTGGARAEGSDACVSGKETTKDRRPP